MNNFNFNITYARHNLHSTLHVPDQYGAMHLLKLNLFVRSFEITTIVTLTRVTQLYFQRN